MKTSLLLLTLLVPGALASPQTPAAAAAKAPTVTAEMTDAKGTFEVKVAPRTLAPGEALAAYTLNKQYHGDLEATGVGEMLSAGDPASGNAGYVALERISGKLAGRVGSFALMQNGTMTKGTAPQMTVTIVPGSVTGDLSGFYGTMEVTIAGSAHSFVLHYAFAGQ